MIRSGDRGGGLVRCHVDASKNAPLRARDKIDCARVGLRTSPWVLHGEAGTQVTHGATVQLLHLHLGLVHWDRHAPAPRCTIDPVHLTAPCISVHLS